MVSPPTGIVTFLFTDIEGSTQRWETFSASMPAALALHDAILRESIAAQRGYLFKTVGDAFCVAFSSPAGAIAAAVAAQRGLQAAAWPVPGPLRVRMALHTGISEERDLDYFGPTVNRVARLMAAGHGGQILLSQSTATAVMPDLAPEIGLRDCGIRRLKDLTAPEHIWQITTADLPDVFLPLKTLDMRPTNLPMALPPLIGRDAEIAAIDAILDQAGSHVLTLTGPGGIGKTRLGQEVGRRRQDRYADGVLFVALAALTDSGQVLPALAQALGLTGAALTRMAERIQADLHEKHLLVILDNAEHVLAGVCAVAALIPYTAQVGLVVTSREPLLMTWERIVAVPPLAAPAHALAGAPQDAAAVRLFCERAKAVAPHFHPSADDLAQIATLCQRLDGLPLAIELAAARSRILSPSDLLDRLDRCLDVVAAGDRDRPPRHQTLRQTIAWSYDLLTPGEQHLFARLAVFDGGWTLAAVEAICTRADLDPALMLPTMESLVLKNLIQRVDDEGTGAPRFSMLRMIQLFAEECHGRLPDRAELHARHLAYYRDLAERCDQTLWGPAQIQNLDMLEAEQPNWRAALAWAQAMGVVDDGLRLASALMGFWRGRGAIDEGREWLTAFLTLRAQSPRLRMHALANAAYLALLQGDNAACEDYGKASLALADQLGDRQGRAEALETLTWVFFAEGPALALHQLDEALAIWREGGEPSRIATSLGILGYVNMAIQDYAVASRHLNASLAVWEELGDRWGRSDVCLILGDLAMRRGDEARAAALLADALREKEILRHHEGIAEATQLLGKLALRQGDVAAAERAFHESLRAYRTLGHRLGWSSSLLFLVDCALEQDDGIAADRWLAESRTVIQPMASATLEAGITLRAAHLALRQNHLATAIGEIQTGLDLAGSLIGHFILSVDLVAAVRYAQGAGGDAVRLWGMVDGLREQARLVMTPRQRRQREDRLESVRAVLGVDAVTAAWHDGHAQTMTHGRARVEAYVRALLDTASDTAEPSAGTS